MHKTNYLSSVPVLRNALISGTIVIFIGGCTTTKVSPQKLSTGASDPSSNLGSPSFFALTPSKKGESLSSPTQSTSIPNTLPPVLKATTSPTQKMGPTPPPQVPYLTYQVQKGDTLSEIALAHKVGVEELAALNGMKVNDTLYVGKVLKIPYGGVKPSLPISKSTPKGEGNYYIVQKGDTLSGIAKAKGCTVADIMKWNNLSNDKIYVGQKLLLGPSYQGGSSSHAKADGKKAIPADGKHTVSQGETLSSIAASYGMTVSELKQMNGLTSDMIRPGQVLFLKKDVVNSKPSTTASSSKGNELRDGDKYVVQPGDTLWDIARKFSVRTKDIIDINNLKSHVITPGMTLVIPKQGDSSTKTGPVVETAEIHNKNTTPKVLADGRPETTAATSQQKPTSTSASTPNSNINIEKMIKLPHFVEPNDTLEVIAELYNSKVDWILQANPNIRNNADLKQCKQIMVPIADNLGGR